MVVHILPRHGHRMSHRALCNSPWWLCLSLTSAYSSATDIPLPCWSPISRHFFVTEKLLPWHIEKGRTQEIICEKGNEEGRESVELQRQEKRKELIMEYLKASEGRGRESNSQEQWRNHTCKVHLTTPHFLSHATFFLLFFSVSLARFVHCNSSLIHLRVAEQKGK